MRIIYFLPDIDAGVSRIVKNLLQYRTANNNITYAVVLYTCKENPTIPAGKDFIANEIIRFEYSKYDNTWAIFKRMSKLLYNESDIIVSNDGFEVKMVAALKLRNPITYILHGDFDYYYSIIIPYQSIINCFIVYSNKMEFKMKNLLNKGNVVKLKKIYYPLASSSYPPKAIKLLPCERPVFKILFAGYLIERKGVDILPEIYNLLLNKGMKHFELEIIGNGDLYDSIKSSFRDFLNVKISGWQPHSYVVQKMIEADIFLFPSRLEGLPNVLLEALSAGAVPICNSKVSGISDIIKNGENGLLTNSHEPQEFANAVFELYKNPVLLKSFVKNGLSSLIKFESYSQAQLYENSFVKYSKINPILNKYYPKYRRGRFLDRAWLPNKIVIILRKILKDERL